MLRNILIYWLIGSITVLPLQCHESSTSNEVEDSILYENEDLEINDDVPEIVEIDSIDTKIDTESDKDKKTDTFLKTTFICLSIAIFGVSMAVVKINQGSRI